MGSGASPNIGELVAKFDWASTPLGPRSDWPASLDTVVELMLASANVMSLVWSADAIHIYNDAFAERLVPPQWQHAALGQSAYRTFAAHEDSFAKEVADGMSGISRQTNGKRYRVLRDGVVQDAWFNVTFAPVRGANGEVGGVLWTLIEITEQWLAQEALRESEAKNSEGQIYKWAGRNIDIELRKRAEAALRESEERLAGFAASSSDALWIRNAETYAFQYVSPAVQTIFGVGPEAVIEDAELLHDLIVPDDQNNVSRNVARVAAGEVVVQEYRIQRRTDLTIRWVRSTGFPFRDGDGRIRRIGAIAQDVTDQKLANAWLRENEERLRLAVDIGALASWDWDLASGRVEWSDRHYLLQGYAVGEVTPSFDAWLARVHPDDRAETVALIETARDEKATYIHEFRSLHADGRIVWCSARGRFFYEADGEPVRMIGVMEDVTDRRAAQDALRESEERLRQFGEASQDVLWSRDSETLQWTYLTPAFETIYGLPREDALTGENFGNWMSMILPEDRELAAESIDKVRQGQRVSFEYRIRRPSDGEVRWLRDTSFPILDDAGHVLRIGGIGQDVSDEKDAADRMAVLIAELQHRTRNLMGVVRSTARRTGEASTDIADFRDRFGKRLEALARVQGLLSRLGDTDRVAFDELIRTELQAMHGSSDRVTLSGPKGIRLRSSMVQTLAMALHELATNAVKYGALGQDSGHLTVTWQMVDHDPRGRSRLHINWKESGVTMPPVGAKAQGGGQGRELIEKALPYQLNAQTSFALGPDGVHCIITIPVSESLNEE